MEKLVGSNEYFSLQRGDVAELVPASCQTILEIGCGFGVLGESLMKRQICTVDGVEINPKAEEHLKGKYRKHWIGNIENLSLDGALDRYDCILFPDVLEHLTDPWHTLQKLGSYLRKDGYVVASIPNIRNLAILYRLAVKGKWEYEESGLLDRGHLRFFTRQSINELFSKNGFVIEQWNVKRDRYRFPAKIISSTIKILIPEIDVCQYLIRAKKV